MTKIIQESSCSKDGYGRIIRHSTIVECCSKPLECVSTNTNICPYCGAQYDWNGIEALKEEKCQMKKK
jgi:hypothetical protein